MSRRPRRTLAGPLPPATLTSPAAATTWSLPVGGAGLPVGLADGDRPVALRLFGVEPSEVVHVGGVPLVGLVVLRAVALGARAVVETGRPAVWERLRARRVGVVPLGRVSGVVADPTRPALVVRDAGALPGRRGHRPAPWTATVTLLPYLAPRAARLLPGADLVCLERLPAPEAAGAGSTLGLDEATVAALERLDDGAALWWAGGTATLVRADPTPAELALVGPDGGLGAGPIPEVSS